LLLKKDFAVTQSSGRVETADKVLHFTHCDVVPPYLKQLYNMA